MGPFVFFDHMGPLSNGPGQVIEVRPHPHIGLATVTYLFDGRITHRDNLGNEQIITPGDLNWMTAGRGIVHSERTPKEDRNASDGKTTHGIQIWVGLPKSHEECDPSFTHWDKNHLPTTKPAPSLAAKVMIGHYWGATSPVKTFGRTLLMDCTATGETELELPVTEQEMGFYPITGTLSVNGEPVALHEMAILDRPERITLQFGAGSRFIVIGGEPFPERRYMWWNFVSSSRARIDEASRKWLDQAFDKVPGDPEFTPLPTDPDA